MKTGSLSSEEWFPIVDEEGKMIQKAPRSICHDGKSMLLHPVVHLHLFNSKGELFLQKRSKTKDIQPGKWDTSVGGHVGIGESIDLALIRETTEEIGLPDINPSFIIKYIWKSSRERELVHSFYASSDAPLFLDKNEIDDGKFWNLETIKDNIGKEIFTPNFEYEYEIICEKMVALGLLY